VNKLSPYTKKELEQLPLVFRYANITASPTNKNSIDQKFIAIDYYQTNQFKTYPLYKPISKISTTPK